MRSRPSIVLLGSTGSVGQSTLDVLACHGSHRVFALTANRNVSLMLEQCEQWRPTCAVMVDEEAARQLREAMPSVSPETRVLSGAAALVEVVTEAAVDTVLAAIVGAAGLPSALAAAKSGKKLLLANKEALIMAGPLFMAAVRDHGAVLLPIDSEHNAVFQCLPESNRLPGRMAASTDVRRIILTASGGPFLDRPAEMLGEVTAAEACRHPNWSMGQKISVDSATMMNKGLELIEACYLFGLPPEQVDVLIHPQSIVHSLVEYCDGSMLAQLGSPDMRVPIAHALAWPERRPSGADFLDLVSSADLQFRHPDTEQFPCLRLGREAVRAGPVSVIRLNAANEVAVAAFLGGAIGFMDIPVIIARTLEAAENGSADPVEGLDDVLSIDRRARELANELLIGIVRS
ncbi:MAG: 1-deoxy-D-xylulose-5-phosphate reductoisomerase [Pseudohongiellaceae bacterium]